jgi:hypothetical protein
MNQVFCKICKTKIDFGDEKIDICGNNECFWIKCKELVIDNVYKYLNDNTDSASLLLFFAINSLENHQPHSEFRSSLIFSLKENDMKSVIKYTQNILSLCKCDKDIYNLIGKECYFAIRFYLISSRHIFNKDFTSNNIKSYKVNYSYAETSKFEMYLNQSKFPMTFLFHGSGLNNWHSILHNGLKNYSGTKNQLNGATYGNGIYLSNSITMAQNYSKSTLLFVVGVCKIIGDTSTYLKQVIFT